MNLARVNPGAARHLLTLLTRECQTPASLTRERQFLIDAGIPEHFLSYVRELGVSERKLSPVANDSSYLIMGGG